MTANIHQSRIRNHSRVFFAALAGCILAPLQATFAEEIGASFSGVITTETDVDYSGKDVGTPWWHARITDSINPKATRYPAGVHDLLRMAVENSAKINVARLVPQIRQTAVTEAAAAFDWSRYAETMWNDTSDPVGSTLTVGGNGQRFNDHLWNFSGGVRRRLKTGSTFDVSQEFGHENNNSNFFVPQNQATSRIVLGFTHPLLRGRGNYYNTSLILLANIDVQSANDEFRRQLQAHLLEVVNGYWSLYLERASLAQRYKIYTRTKDIFAQLKSRENIDAQRTQLVSTEAALEKRRSDLIRAVSAVKNAETRLRALINAPGMGDDPDAIEIIPAEHPMIDPLPTDLATEFAIALANRPELAAAIRSIKAASVRLKMSCHEVLPQLNLVTEVYLAGLRGQSELGKAWQDQFTRGAPSYSVGLQYEVAFGRRAALARKQRRQLELSQMQEEYRDAMELVRAEVEVAVREVQTAYKELVAKNRASRAAETEVDILEARWREMVDVVSGGLTLESLLRAQERVTEAEYEFARAQLTYNLALVSLRHANGTSLVIADRQENTDNGLSDALPAAHTTATLPDRSPAKPEPQTDALLHRDLPSSDIRYANESSGPPILSRSASTVVSEVIPAPTAANTLPNRYDRYRLAPVE